MKARRTQLEIIADVRSLHSKLYVDRVLDGESKLACGLFYRHHEPHISLAYICWCGIHIRLIFFCVLRVLDDGSARH